MISAETERTWMVAIFVAVENRLYDFDVWRPIKMVSFNDGRMTDDLLFFSHETEIRIL